MDNYDFSGWATRANMKCSDGRTIMKDAFIENDGAQVPIVWNHQHNDPFNVLGHALLENREEGVYAYCTFNDSEAGRMGREMVRNGDVNQLSIYANKLKQQGGNVLHGAIREVSLVLAGANPGAYIDSIMCHGAESDEEAVIYTGEDIELAHSDEVAPEEDEVLQHASDDKQADENGEGSKKEDKPDMAEPKEQVKEENKPETKTEEPKEKTVKDVFDTFTEEQKTVVYALIGQALEDAGVSDEEEDDADDKEEKTVKHSEGGNEIMHTNVFDRESAQQVNVLTHADQEAILEMAKKPGMTFKSAMKAYVDEHKDTLSHGFGTEDGEAIDVLFTDFKNVPAGAPTLLERDMDWVAHVMNKAAKSPIARVRTRQIDARAAEITAKAHTKGEQKTAMANVKLLKRETNPQTVYVKDALHRDDIIDIDFDAVAYMRNIMKHTLEETVALAALVGDHRNGEDDKISDQNIRPIWTDEEVYAIHESVDVAAMKAKLQGTDTAANFGDEFIYAEAIIAALMNGRIQYKGKGAADFFCAPTLLNKMLLARDMNGRRIYESKADLCKAMNVANIYDVDQFESLAAREDSAGKSHKLLGIFVNMANYQFGCAKGGEITNFEDFDIDYNQYKYLMETRLSGALIDPYAAIVLEEPVVAG